MKKTYKALKKTGVFVLGVVVVIIGIILIPLPGPGLLTILAGFLILSREFEWAKKHVEKARAKLDETIEEAKKRANNKK